MNFQNTLDYYTVPCIIEQIIVLTRYYYDNIQLSFSTWLTVTSEDNFVQNYIQEFKKHFLPLMTPETERTLYIYAKNLSFAMQSFYNFNKNINDLDLFVRSFIKLQFKNLDELI
jgi:hypothetical protein